MNFSLGCNALEKHPQIRGLDLPADGASWTAEEEANGAPPAFWFGDEAPGFGPCLSRAPWPIGGRAPPPGGGDSLPSPAHLRSPRRLAGPAARRAALAGALQPLLLQGSQESFRGIQFRFQLCDLQAGVVHRQLQTPGPKPTNPCIFFPTWHLGTELAHSWASPREGLLFLLPQTKIRSFALKKKKCFLYKRKKKHQNSL